MRQGLSLNTDKYLLEPKTFPHVINDAIQGTWGYTY